MPRGYYALSIGIWLVVHVPLRESNDAIRVFISSFEHEHLWPFLPEGLKGTFIAECDGFGAGIYDRAKVLELRIVRALPCIPGHGRDFVEVTFVCDDRDSNRHCVPQKPSVD